MSTENPQLESLGEELALEEEEEYAVITSFRGLTPEDLRALPSRDLNAVIVNITTDDGGKFTLIHFPEHFIGDDVRPRIYVASQEDFIKERVVRDKVIGVAGGSSPDDDGRIMLGRRNKLTPTRIADLIGKYSKLFPDVQVHEAQYVGQRMTKESLGLPERVQAIHF